MIETLAAQLGRATVWSILIGLALYGYYRLMLAAAQKEVELAEARERREYYVAVLTYYRERNAKRNAAIREALSEEPGELNEMLGARQVLGEDFAA